MAVWSSIQSAVIVKRYVDSYGVKIKLDSVKPRQGPFGDCFVDECVEDHPFIECDFFQAYHLRPLEWPCC